MEPTNFFTIIIPVTHSFEDLRRCLNSLEGLHCKKEKFNVVLVDCGAVQGLDLFLQKNLSHYKFNATSLHLPDKHNVQLHWYNEARINEARNYAMQMVPAQYYVFTTDDCTFEPDWLNKFEASLSGDTGIIGGPDWLPQKMGLFPKAIDCILNSYLGSAGMRRGEGRGARNYYPRKENMAIPADVVAQVGSFPEEILIAGEMELAKRIRDAKLKVIYLPDNPVWHWRRTSFLNFMRLAAYTAFKKVQLMRTHRVFLKSVHFFVLLAAIAGISIGLLSLVNRYALIFSTVSAGIYLVALLSTAISSAFRTRNVFVGLEVVPLMPIYHISIIFGIVKGTVANIQKRKQRFS